MIKQGLPIEEYVSNGMAGKILSVDPPLVLDDFQLFPRSNSPVSDGSAIHMAVRRHGSWEAEVTRWLVDNATPGGLFLDLGAHLGYFGFCVSRAVGGDIDVHNFEPSATLVDQINKSINLGGFPKERFHSHLHAVGNAPTGTPIHLQGPKGDTGSATAVAGDMRGPNGHLDTQVMVEGFDSTMLRIDDLGLSNVTLMKIDVEGYEYEAWKGMRETIKRSPNLKIVMETGAYHPAEFRAEWREDFDEFIFDIDHELMVPPENWVDRVPFDNVILIKRP